MRDPCRKQEHFALPDVNVFRLSFPLNANSNIAFQLVEQLFAFVIMIILSGVWPANDHDNKIAGFLIEIFISYRRLQQVAVIIYPLLEIKRRHHINSIFIKNKQCRDAINRAVRNSFNKKIP